MAILIDHNTRVLVLAITGSSGRLQTEAMLAAGTKIVAGVTPGKGGQTVLGIPVYNYVKDAKAEHSFDAAICFVPPSKAKDSCYEAIDAGIRLLVLTTEEMDLHECVELIEYARANGTTLIGPGCAGILAPGECKLGAHPTRFFKKGRVGIVSKSGALSYEIGKSLSDAGIGQSTIVALGGGPLWGFTQTDAVRLFNEDPDTDLIIMLGEIGGDSEEDAACWIREHGSKPVISLIVGRTAPPGKTLGHAGAIMSGNRGTATSKISALSDAGVHIVYSSRELTAKAAELLQAN